MNSAAEIKKGIHLTSWDLTSFSYLSMVWDCNLVVRCRALSLTISWLEFSSQCYYVRCTYYPVPHVHLASLLGPQSILSLICAKVM